MGKPILLSIVFICTIAIHNSTQAGNCSSHLVRPADTTVEEFAEESLIIVGLTISKSKAKNIIRKVLTLYKKTANLTNDEITQKNIFNFFVATANVDRVKFTDENIIIVSCLIKAGLMNFDGTISHEMAELGVRALNIIEDIPLYEHTRTDTESLIQIIYNEVAERPDVIVKRIS